MFSFESLKVLLIINHQLGESEIVVKNVIHLISFGSLKVPIVV